MSYVLHNSKVTTVHEDQNQFLQHQFVLNIGYVMVQSVDNELRAEGSGFDFRQDTMIVPYPNWYLWPFDLG
jgi:hypothetical protein